MHSKIKHHICYNMARTPSLWKFREGWGDIINQEHSTKQTLIFELVPWNLKICGFLTFRLFEFCCHFSTFRTFRLLLPLFDFSDFSTFRVLLPLFDFSDFSTFAATFRLFGLFDFSSFAATFRLFDFSTFRVFFHSSHLRPWMHPGSPTVLPETPETSFVCKLSEASRRIPSPHWWRGDLVDSFFFRWKYLMAICHFFIWRRFSLKKNTSFWFRNSCFSLWKNPGVTTPRPTWKIVRREMMLSWIRRCEFNGGRNWGAFCWPLKSPEKRVVGRRYFLKWQLFFEGGDVSFRGCKRKSWDD